MTMPSQATEELLAASQQLLECIARGDWETYTRLCAEDLTAFEPEARGHLVQGLPFHKFYFELPRSEGARQNTITSPHVRMLGDFAAVVSYVRLVQFVDAQGVPQTARVEETRVWEKQQGSWKHVHFHRSVN